MLADRQVLLVPSGFHCWLCVYAAVLEASRMRLLEVVKMQVRCSLGWTTLSTWHHHVQLRPRIQLGWSTGVESLRCCGRWSMTTWSGSSRASCRMRT